jgi:hypothetical protein
MGVDEQDLAICFGRIPARTRYMPDKCDFSFCDGLAILEQAGGTGGMWCAGSACRVGAYAVGLAVSHGRHAG